MKSSLLAIPLLLALTILPAHAEVVLTGDTNRPTLSTFAVGESVTLDFHVTGLPAGGAAVNLLLDVDDEHDVTLQHTEMTVAPDAVGNWDGTTAAPHERLGFYRVYAKLSNGPPLSGLGSRHGSYLTYCIVPDPSERQSYPEDLTRFGMQGGFSQTINLTMPYLGIRWVLGGYKWDAMEPKRRGEFAEAVAAAKAKGQRYPEENSPFQDIEYNGKKWGVFTLPTLYGAPDWAADLGLRPAATRLLKPEMEAAWTDYAREAAAANRLQYPDLPHRPYQITWEPNYPWGYSGTQDQLVHLYELCYAAIHEGDPNALVFGPTYAGLGGDSDQLTASALERGLGRYLDGFSIHPYFGSSPEANNMVGLLRAQADLLRHYTHKDLPRIGTEEGYATGDDKSKELDQARTLTRQNLILLGEGYWFNMAFYIADYPGEPGYGYYYNLNPKIAWGTDKISPKPVVPVYAVQSFLLEGSRSAGPIEWLSPTTLGYAFDRNGQVTLALWDYGDAPRQVTIPVGVPRVTVYDWMGNGQLTAAPEGSLTLTLGPEPVYVVGAAARLWGLHAQRPFRMAASRLTTYPGSTAHVRTTVQPGAAPLHGTLTLTLDSRLSLPTMAKAVNVAAGRSEVVDFPVPIPADAETGGYTATLALRQGTQMTAGDGVRLDVEPPVSITSVAPVVGAAGKGLSVTLQEAQNRPLSGRIVTRLEGVPGSRRTTPFTLAPGAVAAFTILSPDLDVQPTRMYQAKVRVETAAGYGFSREFPVDYLTATVSTVPRPTSSMTTDNKTYITLEGQSAIVRSPQYYTPGFSAKILYTWGEKGLDLLVIVKDPKFVQENTGPMTWKGDSLQVGFDADPGKAASVTGNGLLDVGSRHRSQEINFALTRNGPEAYRAASYDAAKMPVGLLTPAELNINVLHSPEGLVYGAFIPWKTLGREDVPKVGDRLGVALTVNNMDDPAQLDPTALGLFGGIADSKDINKYGVLTLTGPPSPNRAAKTAPPTRRFSGVSGQSQPAGTEPIASIGLTGAVVDGQGILWTAAGTQLLAFTEGQGTRVCTRRVAIPAGAKMAPQTDGRRLYLVGQDNKFYTFDPPTAGAVPQALGAVDPTARAFAVSPSGLTKGFAARGKLFVLAGNTVSVYGASGKPAGPALTLPPPPAGGWFYYSVGVEPTSGDLLVGSYYPDIKVYRFGPDGKPDMQGGWPRPAFARQIVDVAGAAWAVQEDGSAVELPSTLTTSAPSIPSSWTQYADGLVRDRGGYWMSSSQGLVQFDRHGKPLHTRIGGMTGVRLLTLAADGTALAGVEGGQRMIQLSLDDDPAASLVGNGNEPWRVGAGWTDKAAAILPDGITFLVLDETAKQLWRFDPRGTAWSLTPWVKVAGPDGLTAPHALTAGDDVVWMLDGGRLLEGTRSDLASMHPIILPDAGDISAITSLAASNDSRLFLADTAHVTAFTHAANGAYTRIWQTPIGTVSGLAAAPAGVPVSDSAAGTLTLLDSGTGAVLSVIHSTDVPGGWKPGPVAAHGSWAIAADSLNARLVRVRVK